MASKLEFLSTKLTNFQLFLTDPNGLNLPVENDYVKTLTLYKYDMPLFIKILTNIQVMADTQGLLPDSLLSQYIKGVDYDKLEIEKKEKIKKYLQCFIQTIRN